MTKNKLKRLINNISEQPGIYIFRDAKRHLLYVGKALSLKSRLRNYYQKQLEERIHKMVEKAASLKTIEVESETIALILEANFIKTYRPIFNIIFKDDKSYIYIFISTGEKYPKIYLTRKAEIKTGSSKYSLYRDLKGVYFGPYPSSKTLKELLKKIRKIIPFCGQKKESLRSCFYSHLGLCDPCPSFINRLQDKALQKKLIQLYRKNLFRIKNLFSGKFNQVTKNLEKNMLLSSKRQDFESAANLRNQIRKIKYLLLSRSISSYLEDNNYLQNKRISQTEKLSRRLHKFYPAIKKLSRIECFDISNFQGKFAVGSMTVFIDGISESSEYRRFKIKTVHYPNDVAMLLEIIKRRLRHTEWPLPDLIVVDGGKTQTGAINNLFNKMGTDIPLIGLAKRQEILVIPNGSAFTQLKLLRNQDELKLVQYIRDEAHRFALNYHRLQRKKMFFKGYFGN